MRRLPAVLVALLTLPGCLSLPGWLGFKAFPRSTFQCADVSGNGRLEGQEAERITWYDPRTARETTASAADVAAADRNGDGAATFDEWQGHYAGTRFESPRCAPPPVPGATLQPGIDVPDPITRTPAPAGSASPAGLASPAPASPGPASTPPALASPASGPPTTPAPTATSPDDEEDHLDDDPDGDDDPGAETPAPDDDATAPWSPWPSPSP